MGYGFIKSVVVKILLIVFFFNAQLINKQLPDDIVFLKLTLLGDEIEFYTIACRKNDGFLDAGLGF